MARKKGSKNEQNELEVEWTAHALEDYEFWQRENPKVAAKIDDLIEDCLSSRYSGKGKPENLVGSLSGFMSRRINRRDRLVYCYTDDRLIIVQCRYHY
jgi:toxin-antitoxin system, toxin component, Txe/YoeB family